MNKNKNTEVRAREITSVKTAAKVIDTDHMTDEELLAEYRLAGSPQVFETLVHRYERELYNYLRRFLGNTVLAEDAFQATFMQVHLKCHLFDGDRKVRPWLYTVATNQAIDIQRRNRRHRLVSLDRVSRAEHQELGTLVNLLRSREDDPGDQMEQVERKDWVRDAVAASARTIADRGGPRLLQRDEVPGSGRRTERARGHGQESDPLRGQTIERSLGSSSIGAVRRRDRITTFGRKARCRKCNELGRNSRGEPLGNLWKPADSGRLPFWIRHVSGRQ